MLLSMLERLKQSFALGLVIIKVKSDLSEKENIMYHRNVFILHMMLRIITKVLIIGNSLYFRRLKRAGNLKKEKPSASTN